MRYLILFFLVLVIVFLSFIFVYLWRENQKPMVVQPINKEFKVEGLIPFEQWRINQ